MKKIIFGIVALLLSISANAQKYDISKTWQSAVVYTPTSFFSKSIDNIEVDKPMPVVILLHGCTGIQQHETQWARFLKSEGYIVVLPDSFAMPGREVNCDPVSNTRNLKKVPVKRIRPAEAEYSMEQLKQQPWVDKNNIFLMGHSEGGMAVARTRDLGFNAIIISSFNCHDGVTANATPVMAISYANDRYFADRPYMCKDQWGDRSNSKQVVLPGSGHTTYDSSLARQEVLSFLKQNLK